MSASKESAATIQQKIVDIAQGILDGRVGIIAGARQIRALRDEHSPFDEHDPDLNTFDGIDSETDDLPIGEVRQYWAAGALERKDTEIARCESMYRANAFEAASNLIARFTQQT